MSSFFEQEFLGPSNGGDTAWAYRLPSSPAHEGSQWPIELGAIVDLNELACVLELHLPWSGMDPHGTHHSEPWSRLKYIVAVGEIRS